jgi:hypothetical protein
MNTIAIPLRKSLGFTGASTRPFSTHAIASIFCTSLFLLYIATFKTSMLFEITFIEMLLSAFCIVLAPALALWFSVVSLRNGIKMKLQIRGMYLAYFSFFVSALYFVTAFATPIVLLLLYFIYTYIF